MIREIQDGLYRKSYENTANPIFYDNEEEKTMGNAVFNAWCFGTTVVSNLLEQGARLIVARPKPADIIVEHNIQYLDEYRRCKLDFYYKPSEGKRPVFIYVHGGGFVSGVKEMRKHYCYKYVNDGFFCLNMDYEYSPTIHHPEHIRQVFKAIEFMLSNAERFNLDLSKVVIAGESAGAYLAAFISVIVKNRDLYEKLGISFKFKDTFDIDAAVLISGLYDTKNLMNLNFFNMKTFMRAYTGKTIPELRALEGTAYYDETSPTYWMDASFPPCAVIQAALDPLRVESDAFNKALSELGVEHLEYSCGGMCSMHAFAIASDTKQGAACLAATKEFIYNSLEEKEEEVTAKAV